MAEQLHLGAGAGRQQVALKKGHSLMDWIRLKGKRQRAMAGVDGQGKKFVTVEELEAHAGPDGEIWMALHGFVFNITDYLDFHPGGHAQLMRGAVRQRCHEQHQGCGDYCKALMHLVRRFRVAMPQHCSMTIIAGSTIRAC
eukprot:m.102550 g.102550  ORF g.102550 m.102550 type:complete len:141 (-) comp13225_c0_seq7:1911-2333(-)